jgi:hypothetical protein
MDLEETLEQLRSDYQRKALACKAHKPHPRLNGLRRLITSPPSSRMLFERLLNERRRMPSPFPLSIRVEP